VTDTAGAPALVWRGDVRVIATEWSSQDVPATRWDRLVRESRRLGLDHPFGETTR
jgi:hypothetical protein